MNSDNPQLKEQCKDLRCSILVSPDWTGSVKITTWSSRMEDFVASSSASIILPIEYAYENLKNTDRPWRYSRVTEYVGMGDQL